MIGIVAGIRLAACNKINQPFELPSLCQRLFKKSLMINIRDSPQPNTTRDARRPENALPFARKLINYHKASRYGRGIGRGRDDEGGGRHGH
jgi:hypothetical protein